MKRVIKLYEIHLTVDGVEAFSVVEKPCVLSRRYY